MSLATLPLERIIADPKAQPRVMLNQFLVDEYAAAMREGAVFPPVTVFSDGDRHWIGDGFHRYNAAVQAGIRTLQAEIHDGGLRSAVLFSCTANVRHGLRRTNADKRRAVMTLLQDPEWSRWSDRQIADHVGVSNRFVSTLRGEVSVNASQMRKVTRGGSQFLMNITRIGDSRKISERARELLRETDIADDRRQVARLSERPEEVQVEVAERIACGEARHVDQALKQINYQGKLEVSLREIAGGHYPVIYADPPWRFDSGDGLRGAADNQYPTMETEQICALPVKERAAENAVLFLWSTNAHLPDALRVMSEWGFGYRTNFAWVKNTVGVGFYAMGKHELLLLGIRGSFLPKKISPSVFEAKARGHSVKPDEAYELIERMYPDMPAYLELFARRPPVRPRWAAWGNEPALVMAKGGKEPSAL